MNFEDGVFYLSPNKDSAKEDKSLSRSKQYVVDFITKRGDSKIADMAGVDAPFTESTIRGAVASLVNDGRLVRKDNGGSGVPGTYGLPQEIRVPKIGVA
jgi:hypothetical protein